MSLPKVVAKLLNKYGVYSGNTTTPLELSTFVRASSKVWCNGFKFEPGHLRNCDFKTFSQYREAQRLIMDNAPDEECVAYLWRRWSSHRDDSHPIVYGITIATPDNVIIKSMVMGNRANYRNIVKALEEAAGLTG